MVLDMKNWFETRRRHCMVQRTSCHVADGLKPKRPELSSCLELHYLMGDSTMATAASTAY